jgi:hypothetical protein
LEKELRRERERKAIPSVKRGREEGQKEGREWEER